MTRVAPMAGVAKWRGCGASARRSCVVRDDARARGREVHDHELGVQR